MSGENESVAPSLKDSSRGGSFKGSEASSHQGQELTDDQKKMMFRARMFMCFLFVLFIICAVLEDARLPLCACECPLCLLLCFTQPLQVDGCCISGWATAGRWFRADASFCRLSSATHRHRNAVHGLGRGVICIYQRRGYPA
eukprot:3076620-Rhodomonas_salina.1